MKHGIRIRLVFLICTLYLSMPILYAQSCLPDGISFTNQTDIDSFHEDYPGCTNIEGNVYITGNSIYSLQGLQGLESIGGYLSIKNTINLYSLEGLDSLVTIGDYIHFNECNSLVNLHGLENLDSIGGNLRFSVNANLTSLEGLNNLSYIGGELNINNQKRLKSIDPLNNVISIQSGIKMIGNDSLTDFHGLGNLHTFYGGLVISGNLSITDFVGLEGITSVTEFSVDNCPSLMNMAGCENITSANGLSISGNSSLTSLTGLNSLESLGFDLYIGYNSSIHDLNGLNALRSIDGWLIISGNTSLVSLTGIDSVYAESITELRIRENEILNTCHVKSVCDYLASPSGGVQIYGNASGCNSQAEVEGACDLATIPEQQSSNQLSVCPNPFNSSTSIEFDLYAISNIQFTVFNMMGETVHYADYGIMQAGNHRITWSPGIIPAGMYYGVLRRDDSVSVVKMIKQ